MQHSAGSGVTRHGVHVLHEAPTNGRDSVSFAARPVNSLASASQNTYPKTDTAIARSAMRRGVMQYTTQNIRIAAHFIRAKASAVTSARTRYSTARTGGVNGGTMTGLRRLAYRMFHCIAGIKTAANSTAVSNRYATARPSFICIRAPKKIVLCCAARAVPPYDERPSQVAAPLFFQLL